MEVDDRKSGWRKTCMMEKVLAILIKIGYDDFIISKAFILNMILWFEQEQLCSEIPAIVH